MRTKYMGWLRWLTLAVALLLWAGYGDAALYRCTDAAGHRVFQDRACTGSLRPVPGSEQPPAEPADSHHFLWKASRADATLYLLGSIHLGTARLYPLPDAIMSAFRGSDVLVVELDPAATPADAMAGALLSKGEYADGSTLQSHLPPSLWLSLQSAMQSVGLPLDAGSKAKPWLVATMLEMATLQRAGFDPQLGIDRYFIEQNHGARPVVELESFEEQMAALGDMAAEQQTAMLEQTVKQASQGPEMLHTMLKAWKNGDADAMEKLIVRDTQADAHGRAFLQRIMFDRNRTMADKLMALAKGGHTHFVVVGAGHMVGEQGLLALLRQRGFDIVQQ